MSITGAVKGADRVDLIRECMALCVERYRRATTQAKTPEVRRALFGWYGARYNYCASQFASEINMRPEIIGKQYFYDFYSYPDFKVPPLGDITWDGESFTVTVKPEERANEQATD